MPFRFNPFTDKLDLAETGALPPGGGVQTLTGNSGGAVGPNLSNNINTVGSGSITIVGNPGTNTTTTQLTGLTNHSVLVGAGTDTITKVAPSTSGFVLTSNGASADPSFQVISASGALTQINGDTGSATPTAGVITLHTNNLAGATTKFNATGSTVSMVVTDSNANTFIGQAAGTSTNAGTYSTGIGTLALASLTNGSSTTALGGNAGASLVSGSNDTLIGAGAGANYTTESDNICIFNTGTVADAHTIRIGTQGSGAGQQNKAFVAGIVGVTTTNTQMVTINSSTGQLGAATVPSGNVVGTPPSTDNALARYDSTTGLIIQNSNAIVDDIGNASFNNTTSTTPLTLDVLNSDTNAASTSRIAAAVVNGSAADAFFHASINGTTNYCFGIDNSDSDILKINFNAAAVTPSSGSNLWNMTTAGVHTMPLQPSFLAYNAANVTNATGDGTLVNISLDSELFDQGGNFAASTFTSPVTGKVLLCYTVGLFSLTALHTEFVLAVTVNGSGYEVERFNPGLIRSGASDQITVSGSIILPIGAGQTAILQCVVSGSTKTVGITGSLAGGTKFSGDILC